jgi:4-amino-4-deoxy-L-arabinose transferase-like glycosyltransferase
MLARHDWVVPVLNSKPWLEKPVLYYWEAMISYRVFGVSDWAARVPGAFSATTMIVAVYVFWRGVAAKVIRGDNPTLPLDAALITLSTAGVIGYGRAASTDMPLAANFTIAMLCWIARYSGPDTANEQGWQKWLHPRLLLFYVFMALATLAKGPVAPGLAAVIIVLFAAARREAKVIWQTLWAPGIVVYLAIAAPWYWLVQQRTGNFFRFFFLEQNLARYTSNAYRHPQPFWFYIPVTLLAVLPWVLWAVGGWWSTVRGFAANRPAAEKTQSPPFAKEADDGALGLFPTIWAIVPVVFFSFSGSKLPGYILPAVPAWTLLAAMWIVRLDVQGRARTLLILLHSAIAAALVGAVIIAPYRTLRVPVTHAAALVAGIVAVALFIGIAGTLVRRGLPWLRFVTLVPVVLAVAYILRIGAPALDAKLSARPVAQELARIEQQPVRVAVLHVKRELEYGLNFYRNQPIASYDRAEIPPGEHLVVARYGSESELTELVGGRRVVRLGEYAPQQVEFFWVTNQPAMNMH